MNGFRYYNYTLLYIPAQDNLRRCPVMLLCNFLQDWFVEHSFEPLCKGSPCLRLHTQLFHQRQLFRALIMGMVLDLIDVRNNPGIIAQIQQSVRQEITYPNGADFACFIQFFHRTPSPVIISEWHMDEI